MVENIKKRIIHFYTHGKIIEDFVEARRRKSAKLRRVIHACFYIQCALAACCIAAAVIMNASGAAAVIAGSIAVCVVAFISLGGGTAEKTILYVLDLAYAVICFIVGGIFGSAAFTVCGVLMLLSAAAALGGFAAAWCRQYLLDFSPAKITRSDYTRLSPFISDSPAEAHETAPPAPAAPPPPPKTEMEMLAERLSDILGSIPDPKPAAEAKASAAQNKQSAQPSTAAAEPEADVQGAPKPETEVSAAVLQTDPQYENRSDTEKQISTDAAEKKSPDSETYLEKNSAHAAQALIPPVVIETADVLPADLSIDG